MYLFMTNAILIGSDDALSVPGQLGQQVTRCHTQWPHIPSSRPSFLSDEVSTKRNHKR